MAGIGEKPMMRSGPCVWIVWTCDAAMISSTVSQSVRRRPPLPRACCHRWRFAGSPTSDFQATTGSSCSRAGLLPQVQQRPADVRVLHAQRTVQVPRVRNAPLAAARLVGRQARVQRRIVQPLHLPRHHAVLDVDHPRAAAGAVHAVRAAHDLVVLPAVPIELLPAAEGGIGFVFDPGNCIACRHDVRFLPGKMDSMNPTLFFSM